MPATFTTQSQMPVQHGTVQVLPARPCVPLPCPGLSCLCAGSGLVMLGCDLGSDWEAGSVLLLLRSEAEAETLGSSCAEGKHIPHLVPPCPAGLLAWPQMCHRGSSPGSWALGWGWLPHCARSHRCRHSPACVGAHPRSQCVSPCCSLAPWAPEQPCCLLKKASEMQEKCFLIIFYLGQTHVFDCFEWAEAPTCFYAYDDLG